MTPNQPEPGTIDDLIADALDLGWEATERSIREWHRLGLVGSPRRRPRPKGSGQQPALYSPMQRALFAEVVRNKQLGFKRAALAAFPIYAWMDLPNGWVDVQQMRKALATAVGTPTKLSLTDANATASAMIDHVDIHRARIGRKNFRAVIAQQLYDSRIDRGELETAIRTLFEPSGISIVRGPAQAPLSVTAIADLIEMTLRGFITYPTLKDRQYQTIRQRHQALVRGYEFWLPQIQAEAGVQLRQLFDEESPAERVERAPGSLLLMVGMGLHRAPGLELPT